MLAAAKAAYEVSNLQLAMLNLVMTNIRTVMGSMTRDELLSERDRIDAQLLAVVDNATTRRGVKVQQVEIKEIAPPPEIAPDGIRVLAHRRGIDGRGQLKVDDTVRLVERPDLPCGGAYPGNRRLQNAAPRRPALT